jgi:hypothetical protein
MRGRGACGKADEVRLYSALGALQQRSGEAAYFVIGMRGHAK